MAWRCAEGAIARVPAGPNARLGQVAQIFSGFPDAFAHNFPTLTINTFKMQYVFGAHLGHHDTAAHCVKTR